MAIPINFSLIRGEDAILNVNLNPPTPIGGWNLQFRVNKRFGSCSGLIFKNSASGFNGVSGITITNSGQGMFQIGINSVDTSGFQFGNYSFSTTRLDSGNVTVLNTGFLVLLPSIGC